jgi:hypothetical protein
MQNEHREKILNATSAGPPSISAEAEVRDWDGTVLRAGTNGWVCFPNHPDTVGADAMCLDRPWLAWVDAWLSRGSPNVQRMGFGYMLLGDSPASNTDPYAEGRTADNEWMEHGVPHVMIIVPDLQALQGLPTDHRNGGPWVMWRDTPYAHIMVPLP